VTYTESRPRPSLQGQGQGQGQGLGSQGQGQGQGLTSLVSGRVVRSPGILVICDGKEYSFTVLGNVKACLIHTLPVYGMLGLLSAVTFGTT